VTAGDSKYVIGLTGNIATGKTVVLHMLQELGAHTINADHLAQALMRRGEPLYDKVVAEFGRYILGDDEEINRGKLGEIVFAVPRALAHLEHITHPTINAVARQLIASAEAVVVVIEAIKLIESGLARECEAVWVVTAAQDVQLQRLVAKRHLTDRQAMLRINAQPSQEAKVALADVVIDNSGDILETWRTVRRHFAAIPCLAESTPEPAQTRAATGAMPGLEALPGKLPEQLHVRRARRTDLAAMATILARTSRGEPPLDEHELMRCFLSKAYFLAWAGQQLLGMAAMRAENQIVTVDDCVVTSFALWPSVGKALLDAVEADARQLSCEVVMLFVRPDIGPLATILFEDNGYQKQRSASLPVRTWREAAAEHAGDGAVLMVKQLGELQLLSPI
jgi:dephospho-CoA kinase